MKSSQSISNPARLLKIASWAIAIVFAMFLNMLGSLVIRDMAFAPDGGPPTIEHFTDTAANARLKAEKRDVALQLEALAQRIEAASTGKERATRAYTDASQSFKNWVATRTATGDSSQDPDIVARTHQLDTLQATAARWQHDEDALADQQRAVDQRRVELDRQLDDQRTAAEKRFEHADRIYELKVFGLRLAITLPVLLIAVWIFIRYRKSRYWPFVYGFGLFALTAFFVELVPYLPSFGGYVRVIVGIALTVFAGLYMLRAFQRYVERKRVELEQSQSDRARAIGYEKAVHAYQKKLCPSCDKPWSLGGDNPNFCIHCGLKLFNLCHCGGRNFAFFPFCNACGTPQSQEDSATSPSNPPAH